MADVRDAVAQLPLPVYFWVPGLGIWCARIAPTCGIKSGLLSH